MKKVATLLLIRIKSKGDIEIGRILHHSVELPVPLPQKSEKEERIKERIKDRH